jgi:hypothetical protein
MKLKKMLSSYTLGIIIFNIVTLITLFLKYGNDKEVFLVKIKVLLLAIGTFSLTIYTFMPFLILLPLGITKIISKTRLFDKIVKFIKFCDPKEEKPELLAKIMLSYFIPIALASLFLSQTAALTTIITFWLSFVLSGNAIWFFDHFAKKWIENILSIVGLLCFMVSMYIFIFMPNVVVFLLEIM